MIERKKYLEMCQYNSIYPKTVVVEYQGIKYYPEKLIIWFKNGETKNTARMISAFGTSGIECDLSDVVCLDKDE
mgnify:CR=1 FL=1